MTIFTAMAVKAMPDLFHSYEVSWVYLFKSLFFIPYEHSGIYQPVLGLGYTLNYEILFYVLFYISARLAGKTRFRERGIICSVIILLLVGLRIIELPMPFYFWCNPLMLNFVLGIALYYLFGLIDLDSRLQTKSRMRRYVWGGLLLLVAVLLWIVPVPETRLRFFVWGLPSAILFVAVYIFYYEKSVPLWVLMLGNISYYIYLTHPYCVRLTEKIVGKIYVYRMLGYVLMILIGVVVSVACGYLVQYIYLKAGRRIGKYLHR